MNMVLVYGGISLLVGLVLGLFLRDILDQILTKKRGPRTPRSRKYIRRLDQRLKDIERDNRQMAREIHLKRRLVDACRQNRRTRRHLIREDGRVRRELMKQHISRFVKFCLDALNINSHRSR